jgi:ABC-type multidrug transport system fused ATPase/permease subunit
MEKEKTYSSIELVGHLWDFMKPYKARFFVASILRAVGELAWLYPAYALASIANFFTKYHTGDSLAPFWQTIGYLVLVSGIYYIFSYFASNIGFKTAEKAAIDSLLKTSQHVFKLDIGWHEKENTGSKMKKIDRGATAINLLYRMWFGTAIEIFINLIGVIFIIAYFDHLIAALTVGFLVIYFGISIFFTKKAVKVQKIENIKDEELSGMAFQIMSNIRSAKVMSMVGPLSGKLVQASIELYQFAKQRIFWYQSGGVAKNISGQIFRLAIISYIGYGIMKGQYNIGFMLLFYGYFSNVQSVVAQLANSSQDFALRKQQVGRMTDLLKLIPTTDVEEGKVQFPANWQKIELKNVSFAYGEKKVLDNVTFTITRGEKIGVVGLSGAGKSTLFKLLLKEYEDYTGDILVDGVSLRTISKLDYFNHTAVVLQETEVFNFSLKENVTISNYERKNDATLLTDSLTISHVHEFAQNLPQGVDTLIGEKGVKLSGGEKQRVGIARAVFKKPELLLLDEATSHLDVESEEKIQDSLHTFFRSVTAIVIAHRLTTIKEMDKILVMEAGKVIEQGSFTELHGKKGRFHELWEKQNL